MTVGSQRGLQGRAALQPGAVTGRSGPARAALARLAWSAAVTAALCWGCRQAPSGVVVLDYDDFGPQVASHELLGPGWWQWDGHGDSDPAAEYAIKVVVHEGLTPEALARDFPVDPQREVDHRWVTRAAAEAHLRGLAEDPEVPEALRHQARGTLARIEAALGARTP